MPESNEIFDKLSKIIDSFNESIVKFNTCLERVEKNAQVEDIKKTLHGVDDFARVVSTRMNDMVVVIDALTTIILGAKIIEPENFQLVLEQIKKKYETMECEHGKTQHQTDSNGTQETKQDIRPDSPRT